MKQLLTGRRLAVLAVAAAVVAAAAFLLWRAFAPRPENQRAGKFPEQLVYVRTEDDVVDAGAFFAPPPSGAKLLAVIWIHGWGVNFYSPTYVGIARGLAERGYACITGNTRMHDLGNVLAWRGDKRIRGGGYWGVASEEVRDIAAWIGYAEGRGFQRVVLVGHSAGWSAVRRYQAERQDQRVVGLVLASGAVGADTRAPDPDQLAQATRLMAEGKGEELVRDPKRSFPSYISAATFLDIANVPPEFKDFYGINTQNAGITRIRCPLLAFFGTRGDVGTQADLEQMAATIRRQPSGPSGVKTTMIQGADHMYTGKEAEVARVIAEWAEPLSAPGAGRTAGAAGAPSAPVQR